MDHTLPSDKEITKILFGCWSGIEITHGTPMQYLTWYYEDMTLLSKGSMQVKGKKLDFMDKGEWRVEGGKLINHVTESTIKGIVGQKLSNSFAAVDQQTAVFVSSENAFVTNVREDPDNPDTDFHDRLVARSLQVMIELETSNRADYAKWLAPSATLIEMPSVVSPGSMTAGLDAIVDKILADNQRYTHDMYVDRVIRQDPVQVFQLRDSLTARTGSLGVEAGATLAAPTCSIYEFVDHQIVKQTNYVALAPGPRTGS